MKELKDKLQNHRTQINPMVWDRIDSSMKIHHLRQRNRQFKNGLSFAAGFLIVITALFYFQSSQTNPYEIKNLEIRDHQQLVLDHQVDPSLDHINIKYNNKGKLIPNYQILSSRPLLVNKHRLTKNSN